jgi:hypothetical protein
LYILLNFDIISGYKGTQYKLQVFTLFFLTTTLLSLQSFQFLPCNIYLLFMNVWNFLQLNVKNPQANHTDLLLTYSPFCLIDVEDACDI